MHAVNIGRRIELLQLLDPHVVHTAGGSLARKIETVQKVQLYIRLRNNAPSPNNNTIIHRYCLGCDVAAVAIAAAASIADIDRAALAREYLSGRA